MKKIDFKIRLNYACKWLFNKQSAYSLGKEIFAKHLTNISKYSYCANHEGSLAIYQWVRCIFVRSHKSYFNNLKYKLWKQAKNKMSNKSSKQELLKRIRELEKINKNQQQKIKDLEGVNEAQREIMRIYIPKIKKDKVKDIKNKCCSWMSYRKYYDYLGYNRSTFYYVNKPKNLTNATIRLIKYIKYIWFKNRCVYGREKLLVALNKFLISINEQPTTIAKLRRLMRLIGIKAQIYHKCTRKDPKNTNVKFKNLIKRNFHVQNKYQKLFTDVTYFKTPLGFLYISTIIDVFNNKVLSWNISKNNDISLVIGMLNKISNNIGGAIIHSDHGMQYSSHKYQEWLKQNNCICSMSRLGNSLDNYPIEHHFAFLKQECLNFIKWNDRTFDNVCQKIKEYYKWFNNERIYKNSNNKLVANKLIYSIKESGLNLIA